MQLGLSTYTYAWAIGVPGHPPAAPLTATDLLERAASFNLRWVQFADNLPLHLLSPADLDAFEDCARRLDIRIEVGARGIAPDHLRAYLALARRFASPILRVVVDTAGHHPSPDEGIDLLTPHRAAFESAGVTLAIENHDRFPSPVLAEMVHRLNAGGAPWVGVCLDTVNSFGALEGPPVVLQHLGPLTVNLHVKEFTITRASHQMGFTVEGRPAGQGRLDLPWLLDQLRQYGRDPNAILEQWTPPEPALADTIVKESAWAEQSLAYLRALIP